MVLQVFTKKKKLQAEEIKKKIAASTEESEKERLMKEAEDAMAIMERNAESEKAKQEEALEERLAAKKAKKAQGRCVAHPVLVLPCDVGAFIALPSMFEILEM